MFSLGILHLSIMDGFIKKKSYRVMKKSDTKFIKDVNTSDPTAMIGHALHEAKLRFEEALSIYNILYRDGKGPVACLMNILQRLESPMDARAMVAKIGKSCGDELYQLKVALGPAFGPIMGQFNGYYNLNMNREFDRLCFSLLLVHNHTQNHKRKSLTVMNEKNLTGDTSQKQNWSSFRNEYFQGLPIEINQENFKRIPSDGKLSFDYSSIERRADLSDADTAQPVSDRRFVALLNRSVLLIAASQKEEALARLSAWRHGLYSEKPAVDFNSRTAQVFTHNNDLILFFRIIYVVFRKSENC